MAQMRKGESVINVPDELVDYHLARGWLPIEDEEPEAPPVVVPEGNPTMKWREAELVAYAEENAIELGSADTKKEILAVLRASNEARAQLEEQPTAGEPGEPGEPADPPPGDVDDTGVIPENKES